jgi:hypothetical protein
MSTDYHHHVREPYEFNIYYMPGIYKSPIVKIDNFGRVISATKDTTEFEYLINKNVNSIVLFDNSTEDIKESGKIILPRHYYVFVGTKDSEVQYKPYEFNQYRIVVTTYKDIIMSIDSIG